MGFVSIEYPCGMKIMAKSWLLHGEDIGNAPCPIHGKGCKRGK